MAVTCNFISYFESLFVRQIFQIFHIVKRKVVTNDISEGGLKMSDFKNSIKSLKASWVHRLLTSETKHSGNKWAKIASEMIGTENTNLLLKNNVFKIFVFQHGAVDFTGKFWNIGLTFIPRSLKCIMK